MSIDVFPRTECAKVGDGLRGCPSQLERLHGTDTAYERLDLVPPREDEAPITSRGASTAKIRLDDDDGDRRIVIKEMQGCPQAGIAAADNAHISSYRALQRWSILVVLIIQSLLQPQRTMASRHADWPAYPRG